MPNGGRVLIVDDEALILSALALHLRAAGLATHTVGSGPGAVRAVQGGLFDLIVLDLRTRNHHAVHVLREMRALGLWTPVIVLGGYDMVPLAAEAMRLGAEFRENPIDPDEFMDTAKRMIADHRRLETRESRRA